MRWVVIVGLAISACTPDPSIDTAAATPIAAGDSFEIAEFSPGTCKFDLRSQVSLLSADGAERWTTDVPWTFGTAPVVSNGVIVHATHDDDNGNPSSLIGIDLATGQPLWQRPAVFISALASADDGLVITISHGRVAGLDAATGGLRWSRSFDYIGIDELARHPALTDTTFVRSGSATQAIDLATGVDRWTASVGDDDASFEPEVTGDGVAVIQATFEGIVTSLDVGDGATRWEWRSDGSIVWQMLGSTADIVLVTVAQPDAVDGAGELIAIDRTSGKTAWRRDLSTYGGEAAVIGDDVLVIPVNARPLQLLEPTGDEIWRTSDVAGLTVFGTAFDSDTVYVGSNAPGGPLAVVAYDRATGASLWRRDVDGEFATDLSLVDGRLLAGVSLDNDGGFTSADNGRVFAIDAETGEVDWMHDRRDSAAIRPVPTDEGLVVLSTDSLIGCN